MESIKVALCLFTSKGQAKESAVVSEAVDVKIQNVLGKSLHAL